MHLTDRRYALLLMAPAAIFLMAFIAWPLIRLITDSFFDFLPIAGSPRRFVGFANYTKIFSSAIFRGAAIRTVLYTAIVITFEFLLGFGAALLFSILGKRSSVFRTIFLYPLMIAPVVAGLLWRFLLIDNIGIVNHILHWLGVLSTPGDIGWLSDPKIVLWSVAIPDIWLTTSFMTLVLFAGLQNIPGDLLEAASLDGAGFFTMVSRIIIPLLRPVIAVALMVRGIDAAKAFDIILIQTGGGPQNASQTLSLLVHQTMIRFGNPGEASAMGTIYLLSMMLIAGLAMWALWKPEVRS